MSLSEPNIVCPACKRKTAAPPSRDGALFSCDACEARLRWRLRGTQPLLELISRPLVFAAPATFPATPNQSSVVNASRHVAARPTVILQNLRSGLFAGSVRRYLFYSVLGLAFLSVCTVCLAPFLRNKGLDEQTNNLSPSVTPRHETVAPEAPRTRAGLIAVFEPSVCKVLTPESSGTGFLVSPNLIATNKHPSLGLNRPRFWHSDCR